jgi:hypothetical protein
VKEDVSEAGLKVISMKYSKRLIYEDQGLGSGLVKLAQGFDESKKQHDDSKRHAASGFASSMAEGGAAQRLLEDVIGTSSSANVSVGGSVSSDCYRSESSDSLQQHKDKASPHLSSIFPYDDGAVAAAAVAASRSSGMSMDDGRGWTQMGKQSKHIDVSIC